MKITSNPEVGRKFTTYPIHVRPRLQFLRSLIIETAIELGTISELEETLKWGEPSYLAAKGSTIRVDYKKRNPDRYAMYFKCTSKLVPTFKKVFGGTFTYEKNRAILFDINDGVPVEELKECIALALTYHQVKHLPKLGK